ncbi:hypothetical protein CEN44_16740, partial [Fischerella muscicola CCMEE 5323]
QEAGGRRQEAEGRRKKIFFCHARCLMPGKESTVLVPLSQGLKAPLFNYEKGKRIFLKTPKVKKKGVLV